MKNKFELNFFNDQNVVVFKTYRLYEDENDIKGKIKHKLESDFFSKNSKFKKERYFSLQTPPLKEDLKAFAEFKGIRVEDAEALIEEDTKPDSESYRSMIICEYKVSNDYKTISLKDASGLYTELAKIEPFNLSDINRFIKIFGLPYGLFETFDINIEGIPIIIQSSNYMELNLKLIEYRYIFSVFKNLVTNDIENIRSREIDDAERTLRQLNRKDLIKLFKNTIEKFQHANEEELLKNEENILYDVINNHHIENVVNLSLSKEDGDFFLNGYFLNLFQYAYFQMMQALLNKSTFKKCENCGHLFEAFNDKMRFCPTLPGRKRSSCEMQFNNNKKNRSKETH